MSSAGHRGDGEVVIAAPDDRGRAPLPAAALLVPAAGRPTRTPSWLRRLASPRMPCS